MISAAIRVPSPVNEPVLGYAPGSPERASLKATIRAMASEVVDVPLVIDGNEVRTGETQDSIVPHVHAHVLGKYHKASARHLQEAIVAAVRAQRGWAALTQSARAAIFLRAAELLATKYRAVLNAATMLGQSKTAHQAEIDAACELIDFLRFNVYFAERILAEQLLSAPGACNTLEARPLEGFVLAVTPFNFTSIAGNLPTAPALMGNVVVWKPSHTQQLSAHYLMRLLEAAGLPPGVINMVTGDGRTVSRVALPHPDLAGIHFTAPTPTLP